MNLDYLYVAIMIALIWGGVWAATLQFTKWGEFLAYRRTWITVVVGIGVDLLICFFVVPPEEWLKVTAIITFSSVFIILRSLHNEKEELLDRLNEYRQIEQRQDEEEITD